MKLIHAYIQPHKLSDVSLALRSLCGFTVLDARGRGRGKLANEKDKPDEEGIEFEKHVKLEACCPDSLVEEVLTAIEKAAHTGLRGDGLLCVTSVERMVRISTGTSGDDAC